MSESLETETTAEEYEMQQLFQDRRKKNVRLETVLWFQGAA